MPVTSRPLRCHSDSCTNTTAVRSGIVVSPTPPPATTPTPHPLFCTAFSTPDTADAQQDSTVNYQQPNHATQPRLRPKHHHSRYHSPFFEMSWFTSWFSSSRNDKLSRGGALSSTSEAFSLPVSSPITATHPDAFNSDSLVMNDPDSANGPTTYSYPPGRNGPYSYVSAGYVLILIHTPVFSRLMLSSLRPQPSPAFAQDNQPCFPFITHHSPLPPHTHPCLTHGPDYVLG